MDHHQLLLRTHYQEVRPEVEKPGLKLALLIGHAGIASTVLAYFTAMPTPNQSFKAKPLLELDLRTTCGPGIIA